MRWVAIRQFFLGRTDIGVKNRYINIMGRKARDNRDKAAIGGILDGIGRQFGFEGHQFILSNPRNDKSDEQAAIKVKPK
jgi:vacuolar-type H+-ATPase subunit B/Vma2